MANRIEENLDVFHSRISKELFDRLSQTSSSPHLFKNSLIDSEENPGVYVREFANPLFDESDSILPLTSDTKLFSHQSNDI